MPRSSRSASRNRRRSRHRRDQNRLVKIASLAVLPVAVLGAAGYGLNEYGNIEQIGADYCYVREEQAQAAVFVDYSINEELSAAQRRDLVTALERAYGQLPPNGRLMIFTTARDTASSIARPVFEICRPATTAAEQEAIGAPSKPAPNLRRIAEDARAAFGAEIARILSDTHDDATTAQESPILEQVRAISRYPGFQGPERSFVWLSDGLQNTEIARFGAVQGDMPSVERFISRSDYAVIRPESLAGVDVTLLLVESIALPQPGLEFVSNDEMRAWWPEYFRVNGAASVRLERLRWIEGS